MTLPYQQLLHDTAIRMNVLTGAQAGDLATSYDIAALTAANFKSADWPFNSFRDSILMAVGEFAWAIAETPNHPWRAVLPATTTGSIANGTALTFGIGVPDFVRDGTDSTQLTEQPLEVVQRIVRETWRVYPLYFYKMQGDILYHTRAAVSVKIRTYNRATELAAYPAGNCLLPDVLEAPIVARAISLMVKDSKMQDKADIYRGYSDQALAAIRAGATSVNPMPIPAPTMVPTSA